MGSIHNIQLDSTRESLLEEINFYRSLSDIQSKIDRTMPTLFSQSTSTLSQTTEPSHSEGSVVTYYNQNIISHTAKYLEDIQWYSYDSRYHAEWYDKDRSVISFDESGTNCTISNYSSKLGAGHLIAHALEDIIPLYGEIGDFFDLA